ncbi:MAG: PDZ domain-containing protein [Acidimicrobiales bacterium]
MAERHWSEIWPWRRRARPPADTRHWVHPSELPSFENLETTATARPHAVTPRIVIVLVAAMLVAGGIFLIVNRGARTPSPDSPAHLATSLAELPASSRVAAADTVELTITTGGTITKVAALVLPRNLAVTTTVIPINAVITGATAKRRNFDVTLEGRDNVMGFSIVHLSVPIAASKLGPMPASAAVVAIAPIEKDSQKAPEYDWTMTTLGDPTNNAQGVVHYLATSANTSLSSYIDAIAVDTSDRVVAVLSSRHFWYPAQFVAQVADVVATGHGCHADLGINGKTEQGGGVLITKIVRYSAAAHARLRVGEVITAWNGTELDTWNQLVSTLYLTPAYTRAELTYAKSTTVHHVDVTLGCPSKLVP